MILLNVDHKVGVGLYWTPYNLSDRVKWHSGKFKRTRKDLGDRKLQTDCCFEENVHEKTHLQLCKGGA